MKRNGILNRDINMALGLLGHTDKICVCDCGLPIPDDIKVVDLCISINKPSFYEVVELLKKEMIIEKVIVANEIIGNNEKIAQKIKNDFDSIEYVSHDNFKKLTKEVKLIIRTGEASPYANIILQSGVLF